jgi:hypothetical protein
MPSVSVSKVDLAVVRTQLPTTTRTVSPDERRAQVRIRQQHVQRRYRQY